MVTEATKAEFLFGEPTNLGPNVNTASGEGGNGGLSISADGLSIYFDSERSGGYGGVDLWVAARSAKNDDWNPPVNLGPVVNSSDGDSSPSISADGLSLYFSSNRAGTTGSSDLWVTKRETTTGDWGIPSNLGPVVNSSVGDTMSCISVDGLSLYLSSGRPGGFGNRDLWVSTRATTDDEWPEPVNLGPRVNTSSNERRMWISADGLMLLLQSDRPRGSGAVDIYMTTRATTNDAWAEPVNIGPVVNVPQISEASPIVSSDGSTLYMSIYGRIGGYGTWDLWQAPIDPIIDFNGDGVVDTGDMCIMVDNWKTDSLLCDVGPMPWGDGAVDTQDLTVLAEHLFEQVDDPTLVAHWALDEAEGMTALESVSGRDDWAMGNPVWQPAGGMAGGALEFDGVDDCLITSSAIDPAAGPFSVLAWVKGGAPGQTIIALQIDAGWLTLDAEGKLTTGLKGVGRGSGPLSSEAVVTDGQWHRIGLVWDGSQRMLYADGLVAAADVPDGLEASDRGLYIGAAKDYPSGTYFSGLIDDVRIYNRAAMP